MMGVGIRGVGVARARGFNPSSLFAGGTVAGTWYDPSDPTTLFTTSTGTTPCAVPGSGSQVLVGLMLDKSQGAPGALGAELMTTPYSGAASGTWAISSTSVTRNSSTSGQATLVLIGAISTSKWYQVQFTVANLSGDTFFYRTGGGGTAYQITSNGVYTARVLGGGTGSSLIFAPWAGGAGEATITNISVREIPGNHAIAFNNTTARPELSARVNLLTYSEEFENAAHWTVLDVTVAANTTIAPNGTLTAESLVESATSGRHMLYRLFDTVSGTTYTLSVRAKNLSRRYVAIQLKNLTSSSPRYSAVFDLVSGVVTTSNSTGSPVNTSNSILNLGDGWFQLSISMQAASASTFVEFGLSNSAFPSYSEGMPNYTGDGTSGIFIWGADLRPANIGSAIPAYQRIADQYTYDSNGFPTYLRFDGVDDSMYTPASIPFATVTSDGLARRNLLTFGADITNPIWLMLGSASASRLANVTTAPDGTLTADSYSVGTGSGAWYIANYADPSIVSGQAYTASVYVKSNGYNFAFIRPHNNSANLGASGFIVSLIDGTITYPSTPTLPASTGAAVNVGNGWWRITATSTANLTTATTGGPGIWPCPTNTFASSNGVAPASFTGDGTSGIFIWGAQLETGSTATAFQNIGTDKMSVFAGVRKLSDAAGGSVVETIPNYTATGAFGVFSPDASSPSSYSFGMTAAVGAQVGATPANYAAPITSVLQSSMDLSQLAYAGLTARANGQSVALSYGGAGVVTTGNFGTRPVCIGSRDNASFRFNGHLYSLITAGTQLQSGSITATEQYVAGKTGVQI